MMLSTGIRRAFYLVLSCTLCTSANAETNALEEIVVSAQKRAQNVQDVGITITAFTGEQLRELGAQSLDDVPRFTPGVVLSDEYGTAQPTWVIRGVGLTDFSANNTPAAAIYVDDVYMTSNVMGGVNLMDIERIEVLKGPQGALYGRNTSGGAVLLVSRKPVLNSNEGEAFISYGRWNDTIVEGVVNTPLAENVALRVAGRWNESDEGWQENLVTGENHGKKDLWAARAMLLAEIGESSNLLLNFHGGEDSSETVLGRTIGLYDPLTGGFCAPLLAGQLDDDNCASNSTFYDPEFRFPGVQSDDGHKTLSDPINQLNNKYSGGSMNFTSEFQKAVFTSISAFESFDYGLTFDYDGSNGEFGHQRASSMIDFFSQEFRLASTTSGPVTWLVGLEYAEDELNEDRDFLIGDDLAIVSIIGFDRANLKYEQSTKSIASYGQIDWQFADQWSANFGLRYTDETKKYRDGDFDIFLDGESFPFYSGLESDTDLNLWSWKAGLNWTPTDASLIYALISRGFKSGGFFGGFPSDGQGSIEPYKPETVIAYELGFKSQWLENSLQLNGAVFYYDYTDAQGYLTVFSEFSQTVITRLGNQGDAEHKGAELDMLWRATDRFTLQAGVAWLDARITDSDATAYSWLGTEESLANRKRANSPEFSYSFVGLYEIPMGTKMLTLQADYSWRDARDGDGLSVIESTMFNELGAYGLLGGRIALSAPDANWELALWGRNLTDELYFVNVATDDVASWMKLPGEPINYGLEFRYFW